MSTCKQTSNNHCFFNQKKMTWVFPKIGVFPPKSSILIWFSLINHPFWGNTHFRVFPTSPPVFGVSGRIAHPVKLGATEADERRWWWLPPRGVFRDPADPMIRIHMGLVDPQKFNGWNLKITIVRKGVKHLPPMGPHGFGFQPLVLREIFSIPRFTIFYHSKQPNVGKYTIHGMG